MVMKPLPDLVILGALLLGAIVAVIAHRLPRVQERPIDWDPYAWRVWRLRMEKGAVQGAGASTLQGIRRRVIALVRARLHGVRSPIPAVPLHPDFARGQARLERALSCNDGRLL